jgi:alpha-N-arabinofuranosidase
VPFVDVAATHDPASGQLSLLMLNRDLEGEREVVLDCRDFTPTRVLAAETLTGADLKATNTFERPTLVAPRPLEAPRVASTMTFKLPARSYSVAHIATS